jgi:hypothetical protein
MLGMCYLQMTRRMLKIEEGVARKLFATIRYRFSHLDNGFDWETVCGQVGRSAITHKSLTTRWLVMPLGLLWNTGVPVVVAD